MTDAPRGPTTEAPAHTGFGDCACYDCWPVEPEMPLADHGHPAGLLRSLWIVFCGARFNVRDRNA